MKNLDDIKRKIQNILAKAQDGSGATEAEAQGALEFARRLMLRHQLTEADLGQKRNRTASEIAADTEYGTADAFSSSRNMSAWEWILVCAINKLIGTTNAYRTSPTTKRSLSGNLEFDERGQPKIASRVVFYGPAEDCRDARMLFDEWVVLIAALARMKFGGALRGPGRSYAEGFALGLKESVRVMCLKEGEYLGSSNRLTISMADAALVASNEIEDGSDCTALVIAAGNEIMLAKKEQGEKWLLNTKGIKLRKISGGGGGRHHDDAFHSGNRDGRNADFTRTITPKLQ